MSKDTEIEPVEKKELVLEGDPEQQLEFAKKAANALMKAIAHKPNKVMIRNEQYLEYGDWQTLARFFGATASVVWTKPLHNEQGELVGYEARAEVLHKGEVISSAEAMCMRAEKNWATRDEFMLRSMAQTRACAKALRNAYGWVAELAGMKSTPAEEMGADYTVGTYTVGAVDIPDDAVATSTGDDLGEDVPEPAPWTKKNKLSVMDQKRRIKELIDDKVLNPLETKAEYEEYVKTNTKLELVPFNYEKIISRLEKL